MAKKQVTFDGHMSFCSSITKRDIFSETIHAWIRNAERMVDKVDKNQKSNNDNV